MKYVLDASVAMCWMLPRPMTAEAVRLREDFRLQVHELIAPTIYRSEIANGLTKAERQKLIQVGEAQGLIVDVFSTPPALHAYEPLLYRAVEISSRTRGGFYDCCYVALAERENCEVLTADQKLLKNLQPHFPFIRALDSLP